MECRSLPPLVSLQRQTISPISYLICCFIENVKKGGGDRPVEDVVIADSGEVSISHQYSLFKALTMVFQLEVELEEDKEGNKVPLRAEL